MSIPGEVRADRGGDVEQLLRDALAEEERRLNALEERVRRLAAKARGEAGADEPIPAHPPGTWERVKAEETTEVAPPEFRDRALEESEEVPLEASPEGDGARGAAAADLLAGAPVVPVADGGRGDSGAVEPPSEELEALEESLERLRAEGSTEEGLPLSGPARREALQEPRPRGFAAEASGAREAALPPPDLPPDPLLESGERAEPFDLPPEELVDSGEWRPEEPRPRGFAAEAPAVVGEGERGYPRAFVGLEEPRPRGFRGGSAEAAPGSVGSPGAAGPPEPASAPWEGTEGPLVPDGPFVPLVEPKPRGFSAGPPGAARSGRSAVGRREEEERAAVRRLVEESGAHLRALEDQLVAFEAAAAAGASAATLPSAGPEAGQASPTGATGRPAEAAAGAQPESAGGAQAPPADFARYALERAFGAAGSGVWRRLVEGQTRLAARLDAAIERLASLEESLAAPYEIDAIRRVEGTLGELGRQLGATTALLERLGRRVDALDARADARSLDSGATQRLIRLLRSQPARRVG
ncbi:MAG: hypothetical protein D6731_24885, partial [Planctomycetota bacterium]